MMEDPGDTKRETFRGNESGVAKAIAAGALAVLPIGATEQHGPHLPSGTDYFTVEAVSREAAALASEIPIIVTPALPFGSSHHHFIFGATLSLSTETYYRVLCELVESLVTDGFTRIFLVNGHGGNHELAELAARDTARQHPVKVAAGSYWRIAWSELIAANGHVGRNSSAMRGDFDTSMVMSLRPARPRQSPASGRRIQDRSGAAPRLSSREPHVLAGISTDSRTVRTEVGTAAKGDIFRAAVVKGLARTFVEFYRS